MKLIGKVHITTIDLPDEIQFIVVRDRGLLVLCLTPTLCVAVITYACLSQHWSWTLFGIFGLISSVFWYLKGPVTKLFVTRNALRATGNVNRLTTDKIVIPASEVRYLGFSTGGENDPSGLYVSRGWRHTCLLPELGKRDTIAIADAIHARFPNYSRQDDSGIAVVIQ